MKNEMSYQEFRELVKSGTNKFGAKPQELDGVRYASKLEAAVAGMLLMELRQGVWDRIERQVEVFLTNSEICFVIDFCTWKVGIPTFHEAKGKELERFKIMKKLWPDYGPAPLKIWKAAGRVPEVKQTIIPEAINGA